MHKITEKEFLHDMFLVSIVIKGMDGILELFGGLIILMLRSGSIVNMLQRVFQHELIQDPTDLFANYLIHSSGVLTTGALTFAALYLILHGVIKVGLVTGLWAKILWVYPTAGVILSFFIVYQAARVYTRHSVMLLVLTLVDLVILALLSSEYRRLKKHPDFKKNKR